MLGQAGQYGPKGINQDLKGRNRHKVKMTVFHQEQKGMGSAHEDPPAKSDYHGFEWPVSSEGLDIVK